MRKIVPIALASAVMTACVGPVDDTSSSSVSSVSSATQQTSRSQTTISSAPTVSSSSSVAPSSSSQATTSSAGGGSAYIDFATNTQRGEDLYYSRALHPDNKSCADCHGVDSNGAPYGGNSPSPWPLKPDQKAPQDFFVAIHTTMPLFNPENCDAQCAADITAYLQTWKEDAVTCESADAINYSPRALKLLTVDEYQNTIQDLLGFDEDIRGELVVDSERGGFPNNIATNIDLSRADKYWELADRVSTWVIENRKPFDCTAGCAAKFVDDLLPRLFRRPITAAERTQYEELLDTGDAKIAFIAALTSPQFLYRSELGKKVSEVLSTEPESYYRPDPDSITTWNIGTLNADGFTRAQNYIGGQMTYAWTGNDVVSFTIQIGKDGNGNYPKVTFKADNKEYPIEFTSDRPKTVRLRIEGAAAGNRYVDFNGGNNVPFYISPLSFGAAVLYTPSRGDEAKMRQADADSYVLDPFEYASLLSYTLTGSAPDNELWNAAMNDGLHYEEQIRAQVERLIDSPRGRKQIGEMASHWFDTYKITTSLWDRDMALFPNYTPAVRQAMTEEVRELFREVFFNNRPFDSFYGGDFTVVNKALSEYYGISSGASSNSDWRVVEGLNKRGGMLTSGAFMTLHAHAEKTRPIIRAVRVREQMLCQHILPPPIFEGGEREQLLEIANNEYHSGMTTIREYNEAITNHPACYSCHQYKINPLFGMEDFDQTGQWRATEKSYGGLNTLTINATGKLYGPIDIEDTSEANAISFNGAKELSKAIASLPGVEECLIEKSFRFVAGLPINDKGVDKVAQEPYLTGAQKSDYACAAQSAKTAYETSNRSARSVITELVMQDLMRYRK